MLLRQIFDPQLAQYAYLVGCPRSGEALLIDPERDIDRYQKLARDNGLRITAIAETHIHADFVSGAQEFAQDPAIHLYLSDEGGPDWSYTWPKGRPNTHLLKDGETFKVGNISVKAVLTPGHTPEHMSFLITDLGSGATEPIALVTGDFLFMGDVGRPDLLESAAGMKNVMEPSARTLRESLATTLTPFGDYLQILPAHGAGSACGKSLGAVPTTTLGYERRFNSPFKLALKDSEAFVKDILQGQPDPPLYFATMKRVNRDGVAVTGGIPQAERLSATTLQDILKKERGVTVIDTRDDRSDFHRGHIPSSISAPLHSPFFSNSVGSYLAEGDSFVLLVESAEVLDVAIRQMYRIGFDKLKGWSLIEDARAAGLCNTQTDTRNVASFKPLTSEAEGIVLDVRTTAEYNSGHLQGALSIPYTRLRDRLNDVPRGKRLYIHCGSGKRASLAASFLAARGFDVVFLDGDFASCLKNTAHS